MDNINQNDVLNNNALKAMRDEYIKRYIGEQYFLRRKAIDKRMADMLEASKQANRMDLAKYSSQLRQQEESTKEQNREQLKNIPPSQKTIPGLLEFNATQNMLSSDLVQGLKNTKKIFDSLGITPEELAKMGDNLPLSPEGADQVKKLGKLVDSELDRISKSKAKYNAVLIGPKGETSLGSYVLPHWINQEAFLTTVQDIIRGVKKRNPVIPYSKVMNLLQTGIPLFEEAKTNPLITTNPKAKSFSGNIVDHDDFQKVYKDIDSAVKAHSNWIWVPQAQMFIPKEKYDKLKSMTGYILANGKIADITGPRSAAMFSPQDPDWTFLSSLPEGKRKEFIAALGQPVNNTKASQSAGIRNLLISSTFDPAYRAKLLKVIPYWAGDHGISSGTLAKLIKANRGYNEVVTPAPKSKLVSPVSEMFEQTQPPLDTRTPLQKLKGREEIVGTGLGTAYALKKGIPPFYSFMKRFIPAAVRYSTPFLKTLGKGALKYAPEIGSLAAIGLPLIDYYEEKKKAQRKPPINGQP